MAWEKHQAFSFKRKCQCLHTHFLEVHAMLKPLDGLRSNLGC